MLKSKPRVGNVQNDEGKMRWAASVRIGLFTVFVSSTVGLQQSAARGETPASKNSSLEFGLKADTDNESPSTRISQGKVYFVTNRKYDDNEKRQARLHHRIASYESIFRSEIDFAPHFGWVIIGYPSNRQRADQNYASDSTSENPLLNFSVLEDHIFQTRTNFETEIGKIISISNKRSLLYIHGLNASFSDAVNRLAQLNADLDHPVIPIAFSWPSDAERLMSVLPGGGIFPAGYRHIQDLSRQSVKYLSEAISALDQSAGNLSFDIIAHSMGGELATQAVTSWEQSLSSSQPHDHRYGPKTIILAAPDIDILDFDQNVKPQLIRHGSSLFVYCSDDRALKVSKVFNDQKIRLGFCAKDTNYLDSVRYIRVNGAIKDFARHSYYLNEPKILDDMDKIINGTTGGTAYNRDIQLP